MAGDGRSATAPRPTQQAKLRPPARPECYLERPRLDDLLDAFTARPLTLVVAPAGAGKTQALVSWAAHATVPTAWLSLDESDDDPVELWTSMIAALDTLAAGIGDAAEPLVAGRAPVGDIVRALLNALKLAAHERAALIVDDVHHLRSAASADSFALFVQYVPPWLPVVVAGRNEPRLPLGRLRRKRYIAEVRAPELRFTETEERELRALVEPATNTPVATISDGASAP